MQAPGVSWMWVCHRLTESNHRFSIGGREKNDVSWSVQEIHHVPQQAKLANFSVVLVLTFS